MPIKKSGLWGRHYYLCFHLWYSERLNNMPITELPVGGARFALQSWLASNFPLYQASRKIYAESPLRTQNHCQLAPSLFFRDAYLEWKSVTYHTLFSPTPTEERVAAGPICKNGCHTCGIILVSLQSEGHRAGNGTPFHRWINRSSERFDDWPPRPS